MGRRVGGRCSFRTNMDRDFFRTVLSVLPRASICDRVGTQAADVYLVNFVAMESAV
jgi:hypothetical protein